MTNLFGMLGNALGNQPDWGTILLLMLVFFIPIYFVIRMLSGAAWANSGKSVSGASLPEINTGNEPLSGGVIWEREKNPEGTIQGLSRLLSRFGNINISRSVTIGKPIIYKLGNEELQRAGALLKTGTDMDSICREVDPNYAKLGSIEQAMFREALETILKSQS